MPATPPKSDLLRNTDWVVFHYRNLVSLKKFILIFETELDSGKERGEPRATAGPPSKIGGRAGIGYLSAAIAPAGTEACLPHRALCHKSSRHREETRLLAA